MARRRYLSTTISTDKAVNRLAMLYGDFAALLYTWLIPHAADDCSFPADPEELMMIVLPGRRDKESADIQTAIDAMLAESLILHDPDDPNALIFPPKSFYRHQTYIKEERQRKTPQNSAHSGTAGTAAQSSASRVYASSSVSSSVSSSSSVSHSVRDGGDPPNPPVVVNPAYLAFTGICEAQGTDPHVLDNRSLAKQLKHTSLLLERGETAESLAGCAGWMMSQGWRDSGIDAFSVDKALPGWKLKGSPASARASPNGRPRGYGAAELAMLAREAERA